MRFHRVGDRDHDEDTKPTLEAALEYCEVDFNSERSTGMAKCPLHECSTGPA